MTSEDLEKLRAEANRLFYSQKYAEAYEYAKPLADQNDWDGLFLCGLILENGLLDGDPDLPRAYDCFRRLREIHGAAEGCLGCIRMAINAKAYQHADELLSDCKAAEVGISKRIAYLLEGRIYEELYCPPDYKKAKKMYIKSALHGSLWAWRRYAGVHYRTGKKFRAILIILLHFIAWPFYRCIVGRKCRRVD